MFCLACWSIAAAQSNNPRAALERLLRADKVEAAWFAPSFLTHVPAQKVEELVAGLKQRHGSLKGFAGDAPQFIVQLERAEVPATIALDSTGRIAGLFFRAAVPVGGNIQNHVSTIAALPGKTSVLVLSNGTAAAEHNADTPLAVGSAAKLAILKALKDAVAAGRLKWDQAVPLEGEWRSLPSGVLQDWRPGTPVTIATLATLMISISDNTATDALIDIVGRENVEAISPRNAPFLTTAELSKLKAKGRDDLREKWRSGDAQARRGLLATLAALPLPKVSVLEPGATTDIEWFFSARELCTLLDATADMPVFAVNPGLADASAWRAVAFKGGSETGVLNFSTRVVGKDGAVHCVIATWNDDKALDQNSLAEPYRGILRALQKLSGNPK